MFLKLSHTFDIRIGVEQLRKMFSSIRGQGYLARLGNPIDAVWDWRLKINTFGYRPGLGTQGQPGWQLHYTPTPYRDILECLTLVKLSSKDVFTDLGAGMGRAVFVASLMGAAKSVGVEILPDLCDIAEQNRRRSSLHNRDIQFFCQNAAGVDLSETTILYIFHSFGDDTLRTVLRLAYKNRLRPLRVVYMNPVFNKVFQETNWLRQVASLPSRRRAFSVTPSYETSIWESL